MYSVITMSKFSFATYL